MSNCVDKLKIGHFSRIFGYPANFGLLVVAFKNYGPVPFSHSVRTDKAGKNFLWTFMVVGFNKPIKRESLDRIFAEEKIA